MRTTMKVYERKTDPFDNKYWDLVIKTAGPDAEKILGLVKDIVL